MPASRFAALLLALLWAFPAGAQFKTDQPAMPEAATGSEAKPLVRARDQMVVAAHPLAAAEGRAILREGGSAVDALVAVQLVLGLVEPQSSGIGGGAFLVYWDAGEKRLTTFDGRETAPAKATPKLFLDSAGQPLKFLPAVVGGRSVGTPGTVKLLATVHARYGRLSWARVVEPAIRLAQDGFPVSERLAALLAEDPDLMKSETMRPYFFPDGRPLPAGATLRNPDYAETLERIAANGPDGFYEGETAAAVVAAVGAAKGLDGEPNPGTLSLDDLRGYAVKERPAVCAPYRVYSVCGMGPPSSGAVAVGQILGLLQPTDMRALGPRSVEAWRRIGDASRLAFADRNRYLADEDFVPVPVKGLLDPGYLEPRARLLDTDRALPDDQIAAGEPAWDHARLERGDGASLELPSTSHFAIRDKAGNLVSMTTTIENGFGSRIFVRGFLLNNELTDFSFATHDAGRPVANRVEPGKRPRSSMAPTIILQDGEPVLAIGSPGGSSIIGFVAEALVAILDWNMDVQAAVTLPHLLHRGSAYEIEKGTAAAAELEPALKALGFATKVTDLNSGLHAIRITADGLEGGADPRREGVALGD